MRQVRTILVLAALPVYLAAFYAVRLPSIENALQCVWRRGEFFRFLLVPEDLVPQWFGNPASFATLDRLPVLLGAAAILALATIVGWLLMRLVGAQRKLSRLETFLFAAAVGLNAVSTATLLLGLAGWLYRWLFVLAGAIVLVLGIYVFRKTPRVAADPPPPASRWLWLALPFAIVILLGAMLPPIDFDVREYHLEAPKEFFQQGRITFLPHNVYTSMPLGCEMLSLLAMVLTGDWWLGALVGKTLTAMTAPLTALALAAAGRRFFAPAAGALAAVIYLSTPWVIQVAANGLVEPAAAFYLFLAVYAVLLAGDGDAAQQRPRWALAGYLAGGAVACKYPAVLFVVVPVAAWLVARLIAEKAGLRAAAKTASIFLLALAVGCGAWLAKNAVMTGNPTYPLLYNVFGGRGWSPEKDVQWNRVHRPHDFSLDALGHDLAQVGLRSEWLSPLVMPLAFVALVAGRPGRREWQLAGYFAFVLVAWWLLTHRIDRFWIPALPLVAILAAGGGLWTAQPWWRRIFAGLLAVGLVGNFLTATSGPGGYNAYFVPLERLRRQSPPLDPWHAFFNAQIGRGRVLLVGDAQAFDLDAAALYNTCFDDCLFEQLVKGRTPDEIRAALVAREIGFVYVHWGEIARYRRTYGFTRFVQPAVFDRLVQQGILEPLPVLADHPGRGYRVKW